MVFYFNSFLWTYNPLEEPYVFPFILRPYQEDAVRETAEYLWERKESVVWEKGRYEGATWCAEGMFDWRCRFHKYQQAIFVSHSLEAE